MVHCCFKSGVCHESARLQPRVRANIGIITGITVVELPGLLARLQSGQLITALATYHASNEGSQLSSVVDSGEGGPSVHQEER
jgi:hypothetical protein